MGIVALLVALLAVSLFKPLLAQHISVQSGITTASLSRGEITFYRDSNIAGLADSFSWSAITGSNWPPRWLPRLLVMSRGKVIACNLPLWIPLLLTVIALLLPRLLNRSRQWTCPRCGYDLRGLPVNGTCPECGRMPIA